MEKKMDEKMDPKQLKQVSGGCIFFHTWSTDGMLSIHTNDGEYTEWICKDCGDRKYTKNGEDISKGEFDAARQRYSSLATEHY